MKIERPEVNNSLFYGEIIDFKTPATIKKDRGRYCINIQLTFSSGNVVNKQYGTASSIAEARKAIDVIVGKIYAKTFVPFKYTVQEFLIYWLYWYKLDNNVRYNTFVGYRNSIENYIIPAIGNKYINTIKSEDIIQMIESMEISPALFKQIKGSLYASFKYAKQNSIIEVNPIPAAMHILNNRFMQSYDPDKKVEIYSPEQVKRLLEVARDFDAAFLCILLASTAGLRLRECLGVKISDFDFTNNVLNLTKQMGTTIQNGETSKSLIVPKSKSGIRKIPLPKSTMEEITLAIKRNEDFFDMHPALKDEGYLIINADGVPYSTSQVYRDYKGAVKVAGLKYLNFHSLRHSYATLLNNGNLDLGDVNIKAISKTLGHSRTNITEEVYIYQDIKINDTTFIMNDFFDSLKIEELEFKQDYIYDVSIETNLLFNSLFESII